MIPILFSIAGAVAGAALIALFIAAITYARFILKLAKSLRDWLLPRRAEDSVLCDDRPLPPQTPGFISSRDIVTALRRNGGA